MKRTKNTNDNYENWSHNFRLAERRILMINTAHTDEKYFLTVKIETIPTMNHTIFVFRNGKYYETPTKTDSKNNYNHFRRWSHTFRNKCRRIRTENNDWNVKYQRKLPKLITPFSTCQTINADEKYYRTATKTS